MAYRDIFFDNDTNGAPLKFYQPNQEYKYTFEEFTSRDVNNVIFKKKAENSEEASKMLQKLKPVQILGITYFGLDLDDVNTSNFEAHTLAGISGLTTKKKSLTNKQAFQRLKGLDEIQTLAIVELDLTRDQVLSLNFGKHTVLGIVALIKSKKAKTAQKAFKMIQDLNHSQTHGVVFDNLNKNQVKGFDFGIRTVIDMNTLQELGLTSVEAFKIVTEVPSSLINDFLTNLDVKKHSTSKTIASLLCLAQAQIPVTTKKGKSVTVQPSKKDLRPLRFRT